MTSKIETLTPEQESKFREYVAKWTKIGTDTNFNEEQATEAIKEAYRCAATLDSSIREPSKILFFSSPGVAMAAAQIYIHAAEKNIKINKKNNNTLTKWAETNLKFETCGYGQHDASWLSFYDFFRTEVGLIEETNIVMGLINVAKTCGWYYCYDDICFVSKKPVICNLDDNNMLHSETGPAIAYEDGISIIYAIHGVIVPEYVVMKPDTITVKDINDESNEEIKRVKIDQFGVSKYLTEVKASIVDMDMVKVNPFDDKSPVMPRALMKDSKNNFYLVGTDGSTKRTYYMNVPNTVKTCQEAHNAISPLDEDNIIASS